MQKKGISTLAQVLAQRMEAERNANSDLFIDYGDIENDNSLTTNAFPLAIPQSDYYTLEGTNLQAGDSVLVAWVGDDAIVLGKVQPATEEGGDAQ